MLHHANDACEDTGRELRTAARAFWLLAALHLVLWTVVPLLVQPVAPLDVVEMRYWGHQWQLGYHKHPPLPAWIAEAAAVGCGGHFWGVYLVSQLGIVACLWAVWRLGRDLLPPWLAFLGACLMECSYWYTLGTVEYNNNVAMFPFWALAILFLYWALNVEAASCRWWLAVGAMLGLAMLCKYSAAVLAMTVFLFLVVHPVARRAWRRPGPYLMILVAVLVFSPHAVWAIIQGWPSLGYAASRTPGGPVPWGHLLCPLEFTGSQLLVLLPTFIALVPLAGKKGTVPICAQHPPGRSGKWGLSPFSRLVAGFRWRLRPLVILSEAKNLVRAAPPRQILRCAQNDEVFPRDFLLAMTLGPFAIQLVWAGVFNKWLLITYGSQFWMYAGLVLLYCLALRPRPGKRGQSPFVRSTLRAVPAGTDRRLVGDCPLFPGRAIRHTWIRCAVIGGIFLVGGVVHDVATPYVTGAALRIHCPSSALAAEVHLVWNRRYGRPLPVVAGDWWLAGNIAFYGPTIPVIYGSSDFNEVDMSPNSAGWTDDEYLRRHGGVVVWNADTCLGDPRGEVRRRFPTAELLEPISVPWQTGARIPPLRVGVALIPPSM